MDIFTIIDFEAFAQSSALLLHFIGISVIIGGAIVSSVLAFYRLFSHKGLHLLYQSYRRSLARSILIGLEFFVAGDIIRSVSGDLNMDSVIILVIIILIRSFLAVEMEMEMNGRWPWHKHRK